MTEESRALSDLVHGGDIAMLTSVAANGSLSSRPLSIAKVDGGAVSFLIDRNASWVDEVPAQAEVGLSISTGSSNDWVSVGGKASISVDKATIHELWSAFAGAYFDGVDDPRIAVLRVTTTDGEYWSAPGGGPIGRLISVVGAALGREESTGSHGDVAAN